MYANWMHHQDWQLRWVHSVHCILDNRNIYRLHISSLFIRKEMEITSANTQREDLKSSTVDLIIICK